MARRAEQCHAMAKVLHLKGAHDAETTFESDDEGTSVFHASEHDEGGVSSLVSFPTHVFLGSIF